MTTDDKPKKKSWFKRLIKLIIILAVLLLIAITVLANIGGSGDRYKPAVEEFLNEFTGYTARVRTLNNMTFFPNVSFDFEGVALLESEENPVLMAEIGRVHVSLGFWDMMFQSGKFKTVFAESLSTKAGAFTARALEIENLSIADNLNNDKASIGATGYINNLPLDVVVDLEAHGNRGNRSYSFGEKRNFAVGIGDVFFVGTAELTKAGKVFKDLNFVFEDEDVLSGVLEIKRGELEGQLNLSEAGSIVAIDLEAEEDRKAVYSGELESKCLYQSDFSSASRLNRMSEYLKNIFLSEDEDIKKYITLSDFEFEIDPACDPDIQVENIKLPFGLESQTAFSIEKDS